MASAFTITFLLLLGFAICAAKSPLTISKAKRTAFGFELTFTFTASFTSSEKPAAEWSKGWSESPLTGGSLTYDPTTKTGEASLTLTKASIGSETEFVTLKLGDMKSQYVRLMFNAKGKGTVEDTLNHSVMDVSPGTDVAYANDKKSVVVRVTYDANFQGKSIMKDAYWIFLHVKGTNKVKTGGVDNDLVKLEVTTDKSKKVDVLTFKTTDPINGVVTMDAILWITFDEVPNYALKQFNEHLVLKVHEDLYTGPFPDDQVFVSVKKSYCGSWSRECTVFCNAHGNEIKTVELLQKNADGTLTSVKKETVNAIFMYDLYASVAKSQIGNTFICKVTGEGIESLSASS